MLCAAIRIVLPLPRSSSSRSHTSCAPRLSSPLKGSSSTSILGSSMIAWAIPSRSRIPREYCPTFFFENGSSPTRAMLSRICSSVTRFRIAASRFRLANPLTWGRNPGLSMIMPTDCGKSPSFPIRRPCTMTAPESGRRNPQMHLNHDDRPGIRPEKPADALEHDRLARAVEPHDPVDLTLLKGMRDAS